MSGEASKKAFGLVGSSCCHERNAADLLGRNSIVHTNYVAYQGYSETGEPLITLRPPRAPTGLKSRGTGLWREITRVYELDAGELQLLRELCQTADRIDELNRILDEDGLLVTGSRGQIPKAHPLLHELRGEKQAVIQLMAALDLPPTSDRRDA
ncbi:P27 family phage terminase small subunit [Mycolicibacterium sp. XJ2]